MLLGGLWHGAAWNFVIWGGLHGALLALERRRGKAALYGGLPAFARVAVTFSIVLITWVFFRAPDLPQAVRYLGNMFAMGRSTGRRRPADRSSCISRTTSARSCWRRDRLGRAADVGLDANADPAEGRRGAGGLRARGRGADDAGVQPLHLFHFLMAKPDQPLPAGGEGREEIAKREVGHTTVAPLTVRVLVVFFLAAIAAVPILEWSGAVRDAGRLSDVSQSSVGPSLERGRLWDRIVSVNRIVSARLNAFERGLEDESRIGRLLRPPAQVVMTGWLGAGNERVYRGRDGWLFYRPDVEYVTGRGFLDAAQTRAADRCGLGVGRRRHSRIRARRSRDSTRDLAARGITLVVMPTPVKPGVHPEMLAERYDEPTRSCCRTRRTRLSSMISRADDVLVFDPSDALAAERAAGHLYLATDTHWRPEAMEMVAERLGDFIGAHVRLPAATDPGYRSRARPK